MPDKLGIQVSPPTRPMNQASPTLNFTLPRLLFKLYIKAYPEWTEMNENGKETKYGAPCLDIMFIKFHTNKQKGIYQVDEKRYISNQLLKNGQSLGDSMQHFFVCNSAF